MKGAMLRCSMVAQREAARQRREATANFSGVFSTEIPLSPVGWLTVMVDSLKHPPLMHGQHAPDDSISVVVRAVGIEHQAPACAHFAMSGNEEDAHKLTPSDDIRFDASLLFEVRRQQLQDRGQQVVVEVRGSQGIHGTVALALSRATRPAGEYDGVFEMMHPSDPTGSNVARGYKQHGEMAPTSIHLRFFYLACSQRNARTAQPILYSRGPVMPFCDRDLGVIRPQSAQDTRVRSGVVRASGPTKSTNSGEGFFVPNGRKQLPPRPQSAQPDISSRLDSNGPRNRLPLRPQSADPRQRQDGPRMLDWERKIVPQHQSEPLQLDSRPKSPALKRDMKRPSSASVQSTRQTILDPIFADVRRVTGIGRPSSAGTRRISNHSAPSSNSQHLDARFQILMMPIARAADLHTPFRETVLKEDILIVDTSDDGPSLENDAGNGSILSKLAAEDGGCGLSREGQSIIQQIEASARDWGQLQRLVQLPRDSILDIIKGLYDKVDCRHEGLLSWEKFGEGMLLLCGKHFSDMELIALCEQYNVPAGSNVTKEKFQCMAVDGIFMVIQDELCSGDVVKSVGMTRCAQRLRFMRMDFCSPGSFRSSAQVPIRDTELVSCLELEPDTPPTVSRVNADVRKVSTRAMGKRLQPAAWHSMAAGTSRHGRTPIMIPSVASPIDLACFGRSLAQ